MSEFDHVIMYLEVVEAKSFTGAAEKLGISANAVSKHVTLLEEELGMTLLCRSTRHLNVTEAGRIIYEKGKLAKKSLDDINQYAGSFQTEPSGILSILSTVGIGQYLISDCLADFLNRYPKLELNLSFSDEFPNPEEFEALGFDIAFGFGMSLVPEKMLKGDFIRKPLNRIKRVICASPQYLARYGEPVIYDDLVNHYVIVHSQSSKNPLLSECQNRGISLPKIIRVNNSSSILKLMRSGVGIAGAADFVVENEIASGKLKQVLPIHQEAEKPTYLFYKKTRYIPLKISRFIEFFFQRVNRSTTG